MEKAMLIFLTIFTTLTYAQKDFVLEPVLTGEMAAMMAQAVYAEAAKHGFLITVTVVDKSGQTLAVQRHHDAGVHTIRASYNKSLCRLFTKTRHH